MKFILLAALAFLAKTQLDLAQIDFPVPQCIQTSPGVFTESKSCLQKSGVCTFISQDHNEPICLVPNLIPFFKCSYSTTAKNCIGLCKGRNCCRIVAQSAFTGKPICNCVPDRDGPWQCPRCSWNGLQCKDRNNVCQNRDGCCRQQKWGSPIANFKWSVCQCRQKDLTSECKTCVFNRQQAACQDKGKFCARQGLCCQLQPGQYSSITGLPVCKCVKTDDCPNCKKNADGICSDPSQICSQPRCCREQTLSNGMKYCNCLKCQQDKCGYDKETKSCRGDCKNGQKECCKFTGGYIPDGDQKIPECVCKPKQTTNEDCNQECIWNGYKCQDVLQKCGASSIWKECRLTPDQKLCLCQRRIIYTGPFIDAAPVQISPKP